MKKILIGTIVGTVILFFWQFLSWNLLPLHLHTFMYSPVQDSVLTILANNKIETGAYYFPVADNRNVTGMDSKYMEEMQKVMTENKGKPMAALYYTKEGYDLSAMPVIRGFLFDLLAVFAACILLAPAFGTINSFFGRWWLMLVLGLFLNATGPLIQYNWLGMPWAYSLDLVVQNFLDWGITGLWFAWYFGRK